VDRHYHFVPAAVSYRSAVLQIYVTYGKFGKDVVLKEKAPGYIRVQCPDRDLVLIANINSALAYKPMDGTYDEVYTFSPFHEYSVEDLPIEYYMVNYLEFAGKETKSPRVRRAPFDSRVKAICDSGGFQIYKGDIEYIDPLKLVEWYSENIDLGMVLDIPSDVRGVEFYKRLAKVQAANTEIMMSNKRDTLELFNIFHGTDPKEVEAYRKIVERDDIDRIAVGGLYTGTAMGSTSKLLDILHTGRRYKHYHILGVQNMLQVLPLIRVATNEKILITSDSSTWIKKATSKEYYFSPGLEEAPKLLLIGSKNNKGYSGGYIASGYVTLPCSCPICSVVKYKDVFSCISSMILSQALAYHNLFSSQTYMNGMYDAMKDMTTKEIKEVAIRQFGDSGSARKKRRKAHVDDMIRVFDYIDDVTKLGLKEANVKWKFYLPTSYSTTYDKGLFKQTAAHHTESAKDSLEYQASEVYLVRYEAKLDVKEGEAQKSGKHARKIKKGQRVTSTKRVMSVTTTKNPQKHLKKMKKRLGKRK